MANVLTIVSGACSVVSLAVFVHLAYTFDDGQSCLPGFLMIAETVHNAGRTVSRRQVEGETLLLLLNIGVAIDQEMVARIWGMLLSLWHVFWLRNLMKSRIPEDDTEDDEVLEGFLSSSSTAVDGDYPRTDPQTDPQTDP